MDLDFLSKRKQDHLHETEVRRFVVKVTMNLREITLMDAVCSRTKFSRAEVLRASVFDGHIKQAAVVPEVNLQLARDLGRSLGNLATLAGAMRGGGYIGLDEIKRQVMELQGLLRGEHRGD